MMSWRTAKSIDKLRDQINAAYPGRSKASDGTIGDPSHQAEGSGSDHNPNKAGVVCAIDITHDPANGLDIVDLADALAASRDARIKYLIRNRQIMVPSDYGWKWVTYSGSNPHTSHLHVSVWGDYDNTKEWSIGGKKLMNGGDVKEAYRSVLFREPENDKVWRPWVGKSFEEFSVKTKASPEWQRNNHIVKVGYAEKVDENEKLKAYVRELEGRLKSTTSGDFEPVVETLYRKKK